MGIWLWFHQREFQRTLDFPHEELDCISVLAPRHINGAVSKKHKYINVGFAGIKRPFWYDPVWYDPVCVPPSASAAMWNGTCPHGALQWAFLERLQEVLFYVDVRYVYIEVQMRFCSPNLRSVLLVSSRNLVGNLRSESRNLVIESQKLSGQNLVISFSHMFGAPYLGAPSL